MAKLQESLEQLMHIDGALAGALVDSGSGMALGTIGGGIKLDVAAAGNSGVVLSKMRVMKDLGLKDSIEDILISLYSQYHLIRPLANHPNLFFYLVLKRDRANLALSRHKLTEIEKSIEL